MVSQNIPQAGFRFLMFKKLVTTSTFIPMTDPWEDGILLPTNLL